MVVMDKVTTAVVSITEKWYTCIRGHALAAGHGRLAMLRLFGLLMPDKVVSHCFC